MNNSHLRHFAVDLIEYCEIRIRIFNKHFVTFMIARWVEVNTVTTKHIGVRDMVICFLSIVSHVTILRTHPWGKKRFKRKQSGKPDNVCPPFDPVPLHSSSLITVHLSLDPVPVRVYNIIYSVRLHARVRAYVRRAAEVTKGYAGAAAAVMCVKGKVPLTNHQNNNTLQQCILYYVHI